MTEEDKSKNSSEMPEIIQSQFNNFWNIYGKNIEFMTKNAKKDLGPGIMIIDVGLIQKKLNEKDDSDSKNKNGESYYATLNSLPEFVRENKDFYSKIENSQSNNMYYVLMIYESYQAMIGNEDLE